MTTSKKQEKKAEVLRSEEMASQYGFTLAFLKSDKSLWDLFNKAVKETWTPDKFVSKLRQTPWFRKNGESVRQYQVLKSTDPATLSRRRAALSAQLKDMADQMGAMLPSKNLGSIVEQALMFNWNESQLKDAMGSYVRTVNGVYHGQAATDVDKLRQMAWRNGLQMSSATLQTYAQKIATGDASLEQYQQAIRRQAASLAPGYAQELEAGLDLYDIAQPYMSAKAKILEMNPADFDLFDPDVRKAMSGVTKDGKPSSTSLWQFEQDMRRKPEWLKTQNAQDAVMGVGKKVLEDMGVMG